MPYLYDYRFRTQRPGDEGELRKVSAKLRLLIARRKRALSD
jgi:hypothetical protein